MSAEGPAGLPELLTREDVARLLSCSTRTVDRLVGSGDLAAVRIGKLVRFHPDVIRSLFQAGSSEQ